MAGPVLKSDEMLRDKVLEIVADVFGTTKELILANRRLEIHIADSRHAAMILCMDRFGWGVTNTGLLFGRDHGSVINAKRKVKDMLETNPLFRARFQICKNRIETDVKVPATTVPVPA